MQKRSVGLNAFVEQQVIKNTAANEEKTLQKQHGEPWASVRCNDPWRVLKS